MALITIAANAQSVSVNKEEFRRGDTIVLEADGIEPPGILCRAKVQGTSYGCRDHREIVVTDDLVPLDRPFTREHIAVYRAGYDGLPPPPVGSDELIEARYFRIVNDLPQAEPGLIDASKTRLRSGEEFTVTIRRPSFMRDPRYSGLYMALQLTHSAGRTPEGTTILPGVRQIALDFDATGQFAIAIIRAPRFPGKYHLRLATAGGDYYLDSLPITVDLALPDTTIDAEPVYEIQAGERIGFRLVRDENRQWGTLVSYLVDIEWQSETGQWVPEANGTPHDSGDYYFQPQRPGQYRATVWTSFNPDDFWLRLTAAEFVVTYAPAPGAAPRFGPAFNDPTEYNTHRIYRFGETIVARISANFDLTARIEIGLYRRQSGDRTNVHYDRRDGRPSTAPLREWDLWERGAITLSEDLPPGDYELFMKSFQIYNGEELPLSVSSDVFTILPPTGGTRIAINDGRDVPALGAFPVTVELSDQLAPDDAWLGLRMIFLGGTVFGDKLMRSNIPDRPHIAPIGPGRFDYGTGGGDTAPLTRSGWWEAQLTFGPPHGDLVVLASQRFKVVHAEVPDAIQATDSDPTDAAEIRFRVNSLGAADHTDNRDELYLWRRGDVLDTGAWRPAQEITWRKVVDEISDGIRLPAGAYEARLVRRMDCVLELCPFALIDRLPFEVRAHDWAGPIVLREAEDDLGSTGDGPIVLAITPPEREVAIAETEGTYQPPPFFAVEAAIFPRKPLPGMPVTLGFRIENTSAYSAAGMVIDVALADPRTGAPLDQHQPLGSFCEDIGGANYRCALGDIDPGRTADLIFGGETPPFGGVLWSVNLFSAGDLGGLSEWSGLLGARGPPVILDVVVIADQTRIEDGVPSYPYPFGPRGRGEQSGNRGQSRYLMLVGHNLPQSPADQIVLPDTDTVTYGFLAYPSTANAFYLDWFAKGWQRFYGIEDAAVAQARARADGYEAVLVRADLNQGILPGRQTVALSDNRDIVAAANWDLEFGDLSALFSFVRLLPDGDLDLLQEAYLPERIHLAVETNVRLPAETIPVVLDTEDLGGTAPFKIAMVARRSPSGDGRLYLTGPIDLHDRRRAVSLTDGTALAVSPDLANPPLLQARIDPAFVLASLRLPVDPIVASVAVQISPAAGDRSWLWFDALNRAWSCPRRIGVANWPGTNEPPNWSVMSGSESDEIWNLIVLTKSDHFPGQSVSFGHHAAAILLRDKLASELESSLRTLAWVKSNERAVRSLLAHLKPLTMREDIGLLRMKITDPDGDELDYRYALMNDADWLAEQYGTTTDAIEAWQQRATVAAIEAMIKSSSKTLETALEAGDCEVEDLIRMTGFGFAPVQRKLTAHLVTLAEVVPATGSRYLLWQPDNRARFWVAQVAPLATAVRAQQIASQTDTNLVLAIAGALTLPLGLVEAQAVRLIILVIDAVDFGYSVYDAYSQVTASDAEIAFAAGASSVIGDERYTTALRNASTWISHALPVGSAAFGAFTSAFDTLPGPAARRGISRGRQLVAAMTSDGDIPTLRQPDLQDLVAYAMHSFARKQSGGSNVTPLEQRAIDLVDSEGPSDPSLRPAPEPELAAGARSSDFVPSDPIRFVPNEQEFANIRAPPSGAIDEPVAAGSVPNALEARIGDAAQIRFTDAATGAEMAFSLGPRLGKPGSTSETFVHADVPDTHAIRITYIKNDTMAAAIDRAGEDIMRNRLVSQHIRGVDLYEDYTVALDQFGSWPVSRVSIVEQLEGHAWDRIERQGGRMTDAQIHAWVDAHRDLNRQGFVWLDNKGNNFDFVEANGQVQVVVMDMGGIVPIKPGAGGRFFISDAELARRVQLMINGNFERQFGFTVGRRDWRNASRIGEIQKVFGDVFDYQDLGIPGPDFLHFNPRSGEDFDYAATLFESPE